MSNTLWCHKSCLQNHLWESDSQWTQREFYTFFRHWKCLLHSSHKHCACHATQWSSIIQLKEQENTFLTGGLTVKVEVRLELSVQLSVKLQPTWPSLPLTPPTQFTFMHCQCLISEIRKHTGKLALHDQTIAVSYLATRRKIIRVIIIITLLRFCY